jgi:hypothetical protein
MRWAGYVACTGDRKGAYRILVGKPEGKTPFRRLSVDGMMILKLIFQEIGWRT